MSTRFARSSRRQRVQRMRRGLLLIESHSPSNEMKVSHRWRQRGSYAVERLKSSQSEGTEQPAVGSTDWLDLPWVLPVVFANIAAQVPSRDIRRGVAVKCNAPCAVCLLGKVVAVP